MVLPVPPPTLFARITGIGPSDQERFLKRQAEEVRSEEAMRLKKRQELEMKEYQQKIQEVNTRHKKRVQKFMSGAGIFETHSQMEHFVRVELARAAGVAMRATYIIDGTGTLRHMAINDLPVGRSADEYIRLVQAFQYTDEFGEVCPAGWTPGKATMVPNPDSKKTEEFWEKEHGK